MDPSTRLVVSAAEPMSRIQEANTNPKVIYETVQNGNGENGVKKESKNDKADKRS